MAFRAAIVKSSAITKHRRMDAGFFLGLAEQKRQEADVARAEAAVRQALSRLRTAKKHRAAAEARLAALIASGDVTPITPVESWPKNP